MAKADSGKKQLKRKAKKPSGEPFSLKQWFAERTVLSFVLVFALFGAIFYGLMLTSFYQTRLFPAIVHLNALISGGFLNLVGEGVRVDGPNITSSRFSLSIANGCDAMEPIVFFTAVVLAFPSKWLEKGIGILAGVATLFLINQIRIISLFYIGIYFPKAFHVMHVDVWQVLFILFAIIFWISWIRWSMKREKLTTHAEA
jgi:exosortase H (IPTLxxWG-CTERM-specific)